MTRQAGDEVAGAVDRIDSEGQRCVGEPLYQGRVGGGGFLADDQGTGETCAQGGGDGAFGGLIGCGDGVEHRGLVTHICVGQRLEAGHDLDAGGLGEDVRDVGDVSLGKLHLFVSSPGGLRDGG
jgi:hypothetical protein